jgi:hypothetical protein
MDRKLARVFIIGIFTFSLFTNLPGFASVKSPEDLPLQSQAVQDPVYLPLIFRNVHLPNVFGVETIALNTNTFYAAAGLQTYWMSYFSFDWKSIEPVDVDPLLYDWTKVNESKLIEANFRGFTIIATVKNIPFWAQKIDDPNSIPCSPIKDDPATIAEFQEFIRALATRYSAPPFNIRYWQFGNEPDVSPVSLGSSVYEMPFGCWGDVTDPNYYGGEYYGKFLQIFSETIKSVNSSAQITNGGLLLDCHPVNDAPDCPSGNFFAGIMKHLSEHGGLDALDLVSYHVYTRWYANLSLDETWKGFTSHGGVLLGKSFFLREVMSAYGVDPLKPLLVSEGGVMCMRRDDMPPLPSGIKCSDTTPPPEFSADQAEYVVWLYVRAVADDIPGVIWYTLEDPGYRHVGLLYTDGTPKPAYLTYRFLASQIGTASYVGKLGQYFPSLRAYEFSKNSQRLWILWAPDQIDHFISQPAGLLSIYDMYGNAIQLPPPGGLITINSPVYLILQ